MDYILLDRVPRQETNRSNVRCQLSMAHKADYSQRTQRYLIHACRLVGQVDQFDLASVRQRSLEAQHGVLDPVLAQCLERLGLLADLHLSFLDLCMNPVDRVIFAIDEAPSNVILLVL